VKTLHGYLLRQVIATMLMTSVVFTFVMLLVNVLREILPLLVSRQVSLELVVKAFALLIPFVWIFALPMGMLTATLLVFGRFSADQELTAARAGGVSLISLITPVLILSLVLCAVSAVVNMEVAPRCRVAYLQLRDQLRAGAVSRLQLPEGRYIKNFPGYIIFIEKNRKNDLQNILIWKFTDETNLEESIRAPRGRMESDPTNQLVLLRLYDATMDRVADQQTGSMSMGEVQITFDFSKTNRAAFKKPSISDMTFEQLRVELHELERAANVALPQGKPSTEDLQSKRRALRQNLKELGEPARVQLHRQVAFSFACFGFTMVGIPLGIRVHRRETNIGIAIALVLVAVYYSLIIVGDALNTRPELAPHLLMWAPNFLFQAVGAVLLWRANRGV
jgi:lipopolysaccharide export system permease protein